MADPVYVFLPPGRLVQGHPMEAQEKTDKRTNQPKLNRDGSKAIQYYCAIAFAKTDPAFMRDVWPQMTAVAQRDWPAGQFNAPAFAWKLIDGDGIDKEGKPYSLKEGFAGHYILKITSGFPYQVVGPNGAPIVNKNEMKRGDYFRFQVGIVGNNPSESPGLYINPQFAQLVGYGPAISSGPDIAAVLAQAGPAQLPQGASATPIAPMGAAPAGVPMMPGMPQAPMHQPPGMPGYPQQQYAPPAQASYGPVPGSGAVPNAPIGQPSYPASTMPGMPQPQYQQQPAPGQQPHPGILLPPGAR